MDFGTFLYRTGQLTKDQFFQLVTRQYHMSGWGRLSEASRFQHASHQISTVANAEISALRKIPAGDILKDMISKNELDLDLDEQLKNWWQWHLDKLEPISDYSLASNFGTKLYKQQCEKQSVARFITSAKRVRQGASIIQGTDTVVINEGTSCFYVGLAAAAHCENITIVTSNGGIIREYHENPVFYWALGKNGLRHWWES